MKKYFFTYGSEGQPYIGGWSEVEAKDEDMARELFRLVHPSKNGFLPCSSVYSEYDFYQTKMPKNGNFGAFCHEKIRLEIEYAH